MDLNKDERIKKELLKLKKPFKNLNKDKKNYIDKQCEQLAFMIVTLDDLKEIINSEGAVIEAINGNGFNVYNEHPAQKSYNAMYKNFCNGIKLLMDMLPEKEKGSDDLEEFLSRGRK